MSSTERKTHAPKHLSTPRWNTWQQKVTVPKGCQLSAEARANGYTIIRVPPVCREAFMDIFALMRAYHQWHTRQESSHLIDAAWTTWVKWTGHLMHAAKRVLETRPATVPEVPELLYHTVDSIGRTNGQH